jgi:hypothetical protein
MIKHQIKWISQEEWEQAWYDWAKQDMVEKD